MIAGLDVVGGVVEVVADSEERRDPSKADGGRVTVARTRAPGRRTTRWKDQHAFYGIKVPGLGLLGNSKTASWRRSNPKSAWSLSGWISE